MSDQPADQPAAPSAALTGPVAPGSLVEIFLAFASVSLMSFGGVLPWARRMLVVEKRWMTAQEFNDLLALCQFLPGPNIVNVCAVWGSRVRGAPGALACLLGLLGPSVALMIAAGTLYRAYGALPRLQGMLTGLAAAAAGADPEHGGPDGGAAAAPAPGAGPCGGCRHLHRRRPPPTQSPAGPAGAGAAQHRPGMEASRCGMNAGTLATVFVQFAVLSLFAIGGASTVVPEMQRQMRRDPGMAHRPPVQRVIRDRAGGAGAERDVRRFAGAFYRGRTGSDRDHRCHVRADRPVSPWRVARIRTFPRGDV